MFEPVLAGTLADLGMLAGKQFILEAANAPARVLAPDRPLVDPGRPLTYLEGDVDEIIAAGFGIPLARVRELSSRVGLVSALHTIAVPEAALQFDRVAAERLRSGLEDAVDDITASAIVRPDTRPPITGPRRRGARRTAAAPPRDALDELLDAATRAREGGA
jgi:hypothetical protein